MRSAVLLLLCCGACLGCESNDVAPEAASICPVGTVAFAAKAPSGEVESWCRSPAGLAHGPYTREDAQGAPLVTGQFVQGVADGVWRTYFPGGGKPATESVYATGVPDGTWTTWDAGGAVSSVHHWALGSACGTWTDGTGATATSVTYAPCDGSPATPAVTVDAADLAPVSTDYGWDGGSCSGTVQAASDPASEGRTCVDAGGVRHGPYGRWRVTGPGKALTAADKWVDGSFANGAETGSWRVWFAARPGATGGSLRSQGSYSGGKREGLWRTWFADGTPQTKESWQGGVRHGPSLAWFAGGIPAQVGGYALGKPDGTWSTAWPSGTPREKLAYVGGVGHGAYQRWHESGHPAEAGTLDQGHRVGAWTLTYDSGKPAAKGSYVGGLAQGLWQFWTREGHLASEVTFVQGLGQGKTRIWVRQGGEWVEVTATLVDGVLQGPASGVFESGGQKACAYTYLAGQRVGDYQTWHPSGTKAVTGQFVGGKAHGAWLGWYADGSPEVVSTFQKGLLQGDYADWYPPKDGKPRPRSQGKYMDDYKVGVWQFWSEDGVQTTKDFSP